MTTHDDLTDLETRLRASLRERADDVDTAPALYERVQRQASRGAWLRRGLALAGAAAVVAAAFVVVPPLLPEPDIDIADTPEDAQPTDGRTVDEDTDAAVDVFTEQGLAYAQDDGAGGSLVHIGDRIVRSPAPVASLDLAVSGRSVAAVAGLEDGSLGGIDAGASGDQFDQLIEASANGGKAAISPGVDGVAWVEGTDLHVLPFADGAQVRVMPLEGDVPDDLRIEQWVAAADAAVILASDPAGDVWSIPMDYGDVSDTAPTDPAFIVAEDAIDSALLEDLRRVDLVPDADGAGLVLSVDGEVAELRTDLPDGLDLQLSTDGQRLAVRDRATGSGELLVPDADAWVSQFSWQDPSITAVVPTAPPASAVPSGEVTTGEGASTLGLPTTSPVVGTSGTDLLVRTSDGEVQTVAVYPEESEATLGRLAVRPGSTLDDGLVAVESFSEGETSVRFVALRDGQASPVGDVVVTEGPVTGLVWSEDGAQVAWTDTAGLHTASVEGDGGTGGTGELLSEDARPVLDWVWELDDGAAAAGYLTVRVEGVAGVELIGIERASDGSLSVTGPAGGADRIVLDTHAAPGALGGPEVVAAVGDGTAVLTWTAEDDRSGDLPDPGQVGGDARVEASGGQVLVMGDSRQVLVTFDGEVFDLPTAADWDVLD